MARDQVQTCQRNDDLRSGFIATAGAAGRPRAVLARWPINLVKGRISLISIGFSVELPPTEMQIRPPVRSCIESTGLIRNAPGTWTRLSRRSVMVGAVLCGECVLSSCDTATALPRLLLRKSQQYDLLSRWTPCRYDTRRCKRFGSTGLKIGSDRKGAPVAKTLTIAEMEVDLMQSSFPEKRGTECFSFKPYEKHLRRIQRSPQRLFRRPRADCDRYQSCSPVPGKSTLLRMMN